MKLHEYQSRDLLEKHGVDVPRGAIADNYEDAKRIADELGGKVVVKAQVLMGGRGKAGGVKLFDGAEPAAQFAQELIGKRLKSVQNPEGLVVEKVLIGEQIDIAEEYYLSVLLDRAAQKIVVMISSQGGMDIEEVAERSPDAIAKAWVDPAWGAHDFELRAAIEGAGIPEKARRPFLRMIRSLLKVYEANDASLIEINPVAWTSDDKLIAADAKVQIDDSALFRHPEYAKVADEAVADPIEAEATERGIAYVRLGGNVGIMGNGAGLVMCSLDEVNAAGGKPANFLDVGGGAQAERVSDCVELILMDENVEGLLINIFGGITRGDEVARGILDAFAEHKPAIPVVARIEGTAAAEGLKLLENSPIIGATTMQEAAQKIVAAIGK